MKKFFRLVMVFVLTGATLAYTGCTDYSKDLDELSNRIDKLETGSIKSVEAQIESLKSTVASLETAKAVAENAIKSLQDENTLTRTNVDALKSELATLKAELAKATANGATKDEVYALVSQISSLENEIAKLKDQLAKAATKDEVTALAAKIDAGEKALAELNESLAKQIAAINVSLEGKATVEQVAELVKQITALETELKTMVTLETYEAKVAELEALIAEAKNMIPTEDVEALKGDMEAVTDIIMTINTWTLETEYRLGRIEADIASLNYTVEALKEEKTKMEEAITNLKSQVDSDSEVLGVVAANLKGVLEDKIPAIFSDIEALQNECGLLTSGIQNLSGRIDALVLDIAGIQSDNSKIWAAIDAINKAGYVTEENLLAKGYATTSYVDTELKKATDALEETLTGYVTQAMLKDYATKEELSAYLKTADITKYGFQTAEQVDALIAKAVEGYYTEGKVDELVKGLQDQITALSGRLDVTEEDIEALAARIQSISYVPEYKNGLKTKKIVTNNGSVTFTKAYFQVTPKECISLFKMREDVAIKAFYTDKLKAANINEIDAKNVTYSVENNLLVVTVWNQDLSNRAFAIGVEANTKTEEGEVNTGSYLTSDYATVEALTTINFGAADYVLANPAIVARYPYNPTKGEYTNQDKKYGWDTYPAAVNPFDGYEPCIKFDFDDNGKKEIWTIAEVENYYNLPAGSLGIVKKKVASTYSSDEAKKWLSVTDADAAAGISVSMQGDKDKIYKRIGDKVTVTLAYNRGGLTANLIENTFTYEIDYKVRSYKLANSNTYPWTYTFIKAQSSTPYSAATYLDQPLRDGLHHFEPTGDVQEELTQDEFETISTYTQETTMRATPDDDPVVIPNGKFKFTYHASSYGPEGNVVIAKDYYKFEDFDNTIVYEKTFIDNAGTNPTYTKYVFTHEVNFGKKPSNNWAPVTVNLDKVEIPYAPGQLLYDYKVNVANSPFVKLYEQIKGNGYFKNQAELNEAMSVKYEAKQSYGECYIAGSNAPTQIAAANEQSIHMHVSSTNTANWSTDPDARDGQYVRLYSDVLINIYGMDFNKGDYCKLTNEVTTWWGDTYVFNVNVTAKMPNLQLKLAPYFTSNNTIKAQGVKSADGEWTIPNVKLYDYILVEGDQMAVGNSVKVVFTAVTKESTLADGVTPDPNGPTKYIPVTSATNGTFDVTWSTDKYKIANTATLTWGNGTEPYTDRKVTYKAQMYLNGTAVKLGNELVFNIETDNMVNVSKPSVVYVDRIGQTEAKAYLWKGIKVTGNDTADTDVDSWVNPDTEEVGNLAYFDGAWGKFRSVAETKYDLKAYFALKDDLVAYVNGEPLSKAEFNSMFDYQPNYNSSTNPCPYLALTASAALLTDEIEVVVPIKFRYFLDRNGNDEQCNQNAVFIFRQK